MRSSIRFASATVLTVVALAGILIGGQAVRADPPAAVPAEIPSILGPNQPAWVGARALVSKSGQIRLDLLPEEARSRIESARLRAKQKASASPCLELGAIITDLRPGTILPNKFEDLVDHSLAILSGSIVGIEPGFFDGQAGLLLEVKIDRRLKSSDRFWKGPEVYVYYPRGDFKVDSMSICKRDPRWPVTPEVGDRVLLFPHVSPIDSDGVTMEPETANFEVVLEHEGHLVAPDRLKTDPVFEAFKTVEGLASYTAKLLRGGAGE